MNGSRDAAPGEEESYIYTETGVLVRKRTIINGALAQATTYPGECEWRRREAAILERAEAIITKAAGIWIIRMRESGKNIWLVRWQ